MKVFTLDSSSVRPISLKHTSDDKLLYKGAVENFDFGLRLQSYDVLEDIKDRKTNFNTSYYLSDVYSLSSTLELDVPYTFDSDAKFTTYLKNGLYYIQAVESNITGNVVQLTTNQILSTQNRDLFFTVNLSTNKLCYLTREIDNSTYYVFASGSNVYLGLSADYITSSGELHYFEYVIENNSIKLLPNKSDYPGYKQITLDGANVTLSAAGNNSASVFEVVRNEITKNKKNLNNTFSQYVSSYNKDNVGLNTTSTINGISNNYLGFHSNYTLNHNTSEVKFDTMPLKNQATLEEYYTAANHFNSEDETTNRVYDKLFSGNNQNEGTDKIYLSYNIGTRDTHFPPSKLTYFTTPSSLSPYTVLNINDSKIDNVGAIPGNHPLISDKVFKRRIDFKDNNFSDDINATYLCSWLSGNDTGSKLWVDRYYNPDAINFNEALSGTAFYNTVTAASAQTTYVFDISSRLTFETNNDYAYYHIGSKDYEKHIESLNNFRISKDLNILTSKGATVTPTAVKNDIEIDLDGNTFGKFKTDHVGDMSLSFWLSASDYSLPLGYEILGNYFEEGFGIFNTDYVTPNIFIPAGNKLILLNNDLEVYDEIELLEGNTKVNIKGIARKDNFSEFYILGENNVIYVYNSNPNLITKITDLSGINGLVIEDFEVTEDRVYTAFNPVSSRGYFYYDSSDNSTYLKHSASADTVGDKSKLFVDPVNGSVTILSADAGIKTGNELAVADDQSPFTIKQNEPRQTHIPYNFIYKGGFVNNSTNSIQVTGGNTEAVITNVIVDDEDNLITIHDGNVISKLKNTREAISTKTLTFLDDNTTKYIDVILDFEGKNYVKYYLIVEKFSNKTLLHKIDKNFNLVKTKSLGSRSTNSLELTKSVTSFYFLKKYNASKNRFKVVLKTKPKFTQTGVFARKKVIIDYDISELSSGYNHFAVNLNTKKGFMELWVNGYRYSQVKFQPGTYALDNPLGSGIFLGALSTPYNLTFSSRLLQPGKYFINDVKIKGFRMYDRVLDFHEIRSHINYHTLDKDTVWALPIGQRSYVDTIDRVFKFNLPEKISNTYDVNIDNTGITDSVLIDKLKKEVAKELPKVTPYYDKLGNVNIDTSDVTNTQPAIVDGYLFVDRTSGFCNTTDPSKTLCNQIC